DRRRGETAGPLVFPCGLARGLQSRRGVQFPSEVCAYWCADDARLVGLEAKSKCGAAVSALSPCCRRAPRDLFCPPFFYSFFYSQSLENFTLFLCYSSQCGLTHPASLPSRTPRVPG